MLTKDQQKTVADNERLIYWALKKLNISIDDYYGIAAIGLCKAVGTWRPGKAALSSYAYMVMRNEVYQQLRREKKRIKCISLNTPINEEIGNETLADRIKADDDIEKYEEAETARTIYAQADINDRDRMIFDAHLTGKKQKQIADMYGISQPQACRVIERCRGKLYTSC